MADKIDSRGVSMTVRPMTAHEMQRWPDAEIAFTIHYAEGGVKAHALTKIEHAEEFAETIEEVCKDAKKQKEMREAMRGRVVFIRCGCGVLYRLKTAFVIEDGEKVGHHICPACELHLLEAGMEVPFDEGRARKSESLLPEGVTRHGEGVDTYYKNARGHRIVL